MIDLGYTAFVWIKALHVIAVIAWLAGLLYLPRLFVYHAEAEPGSATAKTLEVMERRLLRAIMNPAMIASLVLGGLMLATYSAEAWIQGWLHAKLGCVAGLLAVHMMAARWRKDLAAGTNRRSTRFFRLVNEVPTVLMIVIVIMVVVKPI